jgi:serine phosphatase RsbU (regulator of sigma subunit)/anti-sigma regulatory factor (Ser/Thr protein kinase)
VAGAALAVPAAVCAMLAPWRASFRPVDAALILVAVVVVVASSGFRRTGLLAVASAVAAFDFFLLAPFGHFGVMSADDGETLVLLLAVGAAVSEIAVRGSRQRQRAEAARRRLQLRHEASMTVGTSLDMRRTARELVAAAVPRLADLVTVDLAAPALRGDEPPAADGAELLRVASGGTAGDHPVSVPLRAGSVPLGVASFWRLRDRGPYLAEELDEAAELAAKAAVAVDNGRRHAGDRATALALQRSLLPHHLDGMPATEVASRYLPADSRAGVGGDWFDVIPLSGTRVALVVGDVVGHGIQASATMGRLRTAVRTLADVDLPPAELLDHLDDVVARQAADGQPDASDESSLGVTCLYAVYDPVARQCTMATAGHPLPVLVTPDGAAQLSCDQIGPPLGIGGLPFEALTLDLAEGTVLALYTDGLVESRQRDFGQGVRELCAALEQPAASLDATGDAVISAMLDGHPADDAALLLVRTHALAPDQVATWDIPADPAMVTRARQLAARQLRDWGLDLAGDTTELVVSELVTNAIRHGAPPIQLRLIRDRSLICEVSDASSTAPHLRRSGALDEGGRGLMLVSRLTQGWGARQTLTGKTIWCRQKLPENGCVPAAGPLAAPGRTLAGPPRGATVAGRG